jgi:hypothetical protein
MKNAFAVLSQGEDNALRGDQGIFGQPEAENSLEEVFHVIRSNDRGSEGKGRA